MPVWSQAVPRVVAAAAVATWVAIGASSGALATATPDHVKPRVSETGVRTYAKGGLEGDLTKYPAAKRIDLTRVTGTRAGKTLVFTFTARKVRPFTTRDYDPFSDHNPTYQTWCVEVWNPQMPSMQTYCAGHGKPGEWFNSTADGATYDSTCAVGGAPWDAKAYPKASRVKLFLPISCFEGVGTWEFNARSDYYPSYLGAPTVSDFGDLQRAWTRFANTAAH